MIAAPRVLVLRPSERGPFRGSSVATRPPLRPHLRSEARRDGKRGVWRIVYHDVLEPDTYAERGVFSPFGWATEETPGMASWLRAADSSSNHSPLGGRVSGRSGGRRGRGDRAGGPRGEA
jgi:hypothetical protein